MLDPRVTQICDQIRALLSPDDARVCVVLNQIAAEQAESDRAAAQHRARMTLIEEAERAIERAEASGDRQERARLLQLFDLLLDSARVMDSR
jgi:hypothetical protein